LSKKVRFGPELIKKAEEVFAKSEKKMIVASKELTRQELRTLTRHGVVERVPTRQVSKHIGETGAMQYAYRLVFNPV